MNRNGVGTITFIFNPTWWTTKAEADWDPKDITCITANQDEKCEEPTTPKESDSSPFDVGEGLTASWTERLLTDFSHNFLKTIQDAATDTVWAINAKNTWNNINYDSTMC